MTGSLSPQPAFTSSKSTIKALEQDAKYVQICFTPCSNVSIINFEHLIAGWDASANGKYTWIADTNIQAFLEQNTILLSY